MGRWGGDSAALAADRITNRPKLIRKSAGDEAKGSGEEDERMYERDRGEAEGSGAISGAAGNVGTLTIIRQTRAEVTMGVFLCEPKKLKMKYKMFRCLLSGAKVRKVNVGDCN